MRDDQKKNLEDIEKYLKDYYPAAVPFAGIEYQGDFNYAPENINRIKKEVLLGATGARIMGKAAALPRREGKKYALAAQYISEGQGIATLLEAVQQ